MCSLRLALAAFIVASASWAPAQAQSSEMCLQLPRQASVDPIEQLMLTPDLVMCRRDEIAVTADQTRAIDAVVSEAREERLSGEAAIEHAQGALSSALSRDPINEHRALAAQDQLIVAENRVKRAHFRLLILTHNILTASQRQALRAWRDQHSAVPGEAPGTSTRDTCRRAAEDAATPGGQYLISPNLIYCHHRSIDLSHRQWATINHTVADARNARARLNDEIIAARQALEQQISVASINERPALAALERVLAVERDVRRIRLSMFIGTTRALSEQQRAALRAG